MSPFVACMLTLAFESQGWLGGGGAFPTLTSPITLRSSKPEIRIVLPAGSFSWSKCTSGCCQPPHCMRLKSPTNVSGSVTTEGAYVVRVVMATGRAVLPAWPGVVRLSVSGALDVCRSMGREDIHALSQPGRSATFAVTGLRKVRWVSQSWAESNCGETHWLVEDSRTERHQYGF